MRFKEFIHRADVQNIVSFSGGKDRTAIYLLALKWGIRFRAIFADTGHEHESTIEFVKTLHEKTGGPRIEIIKADFSDRFERRRKWMAEKWPEKGVPQERIDRAIELMHPTGIPFLDLCMLKGRFPSAKARFCTEELKTYPMMFQVLFPAHQSGPVISWQGVRAQESPRRAKMPQYDWGDGGIVNYRPIFKWTHDQVFDLHREMAVEHNPLYKAGMGRVGCFPCIMCQKNEIFNISLRFPEHIERVAEWERIVADVSRRGLATFFADDTAVKPEGYDSLTDGYYSIHDVVDWSKTSRGGRQYDFLRFMGEEKSCSSQYGLCE